MTNARLPLGTFSNPSCQPREQRDAGWGIWKGTRDPSPCRHPASLLHYLKKGSLPMLKKSLTPKHYLLSLALMVSLGLISTACSQVSSTSALPTATVSSATLPAQTSASATPSAPTPDSPTATVSSATLPAPTPASATPGAPTSGSPAPTDQLRLVLDPAQSEARYQAREQLANISFPTDAVGTTKAISGTIVIDESGTIVSQASKFVVDLTTLKSDKAQRDRFIQRNTLQTDTYPTAEFVPTQVVGLPAR
jgi:polyisoprenoid-binding protein YceI